MSIGMIWQTNSINSEDTEKLGALLGSKLAGGEVIELRSDLGGGKTTFTKGLVKGAGSTDRVSSPTFTLSRVYSAKKFQIHHFDFYRLAEPGIMTEQLAEALDNNNVVVVEWADIVSDVLPEEYISIGFKPSQNSEEERTITISYPEKYSNIFERIETEWNR